MHEMSERTPAWFEPRLSSGNLITIAIVVAGLISGWYKFDNRLSLAEDRAANDKVTATIERQRFDARLTRLETSRDDITARVIRIEEKINSQGDTLQRILRAVDPRDGWR
jgi:hypothetical protein